MKSRLYPNIKHLTTIFCVGIAVVTVCILTLRLTLLSDMAFASPDAKATGLAEVHIGEGPDGALLTCRINTQVTLDKPDSPGDFMLENPADNACYITFDIALDSTGRSVYFSGMISPGARKSTARLSNTTLDSGTYECTATIEALDASRNVLSAVTVPLTIEIGGGEDKK